MRYLHQIAEYFNESEDYFLSADTQIISENTNVCISPKKKKLLKIINKFTDESIDKIFPIAEALEISQKISGVVK